MNDIWASSDHLNITFELCGYQMHDPIFDEKHVRYNLKMVVGVF